MQRSYFARRNKCFIALAEPEWPSSCFLAPMQRMSLVRPADDQRNEACDRERATIGQRSTKDRKNGCSEAGMPESVRISAFLRVLSVGDTWKRCREVPCVRNDFLKCWYPTSRDSLPSVQSHEYDQKLQSVNQSPESEKQNSKSETKNQRDSLSTETEKRKKA